MQNQMLKRITACVAMLATVFMLLFSVFYLEEHINHDCTGNDCPVCAVMEQCSSYLKTVATAIIIAVIAMVLSNLLQENECHNILSISCDSLISQKVRMNN